MTPEQQKEESITDLILDLVDLSRRYFSQEARTVVDKAIISPARRAGFWLAFTIVAATLFALAAIFLSVGAFQLLATVVGAAWIAYLIVGGILFLGAAAMIIAGQKLGDK
ncbi:MAG: phage holin family protein [Actinomycetota bacterium]|nr:phage holin family protein [Actinomycetota bacterium]